MNRSVVIVKPDGVQRGLIGEIIHRFERKGLKLVACKMIALEDALLEQWYVHHKDKPFFPGLKSYMQSYPVVAMVWEGYEAVPAIRAMLGVTKSREAAPGTIRGDFGMSQQYNLIHASENSEAAEKEIGLMFDDSEIFEWERTEAEHVYLPDEK